MTIIKNGLDLRPVYNNVKSCYGKAHVNGVLYEAQDEGEDNLIEINLVSYNTLATSIKIYYNEFTHEWDTMEILNNGRYSVTTTRHQKDFLFQAGLNEAEIRKALTNGGLILNVPVKCTGEGLDLQQLKKRGYITAWIMMLYRAKLDQKESEED